MAKLAVQTIRAVMAPRAALRCSLLRSMMSSSGVHAAPADRASTPARSHSCGNEMVSSHVVALPHDGTAVTNSVTKSVPFIVTIHSVALRAPRPVYHKRRFVIHGDKRVCRALLRALVTKLRQPTWLTCALSWRCRIFPSLGSSERSIGEMDFPPRSGSLVALYDEVRRKRCGGRESQNLLTSTCAIIASVAMPPSIGRSGAGATTTAQAARRGCGWGGPRAAAAVCLRTDPPHPA